MKKILSNIITALSILLILWGAVSTIEVWCKHHKPNPEYSSINLWVMLTEEEVPHIQYTAYGHYYTNGTIITEDGNEWIYTLPTQSSTPVLVTFDDNGTDDIVDDIILSVKTNIQIGGIDNGKNK